MLQYAPLRPGTGFSISRFALYYAQRIVTPVWARKAVVKVLTGTINRCHPKPACRDDTSALTDTIRQSGIAVAPRLLSDEQLREIIEFARARPVVLRDGRHVAVGDVPANATITDLALEDVLSCPLVLALANSRRTLAIAADYLGCLPVISSIGIRWSFPGKTHHDTERFHRDPDDWRFVKLFVYLSDVDADSGAHLFVRGTHLEAGTLRARTYSRAEVEARYGKDRIVQVAGPAGTTFFADTHGVHAGPAPMSKPRLALEIGYSILPIYAFEYRPSASENLAGYDPYVNRLLIANDRSARRRTNARS